MRAYDADQLAIAASPAKQESWLFKVESPAYRWSLSARSWAGDSYEAKVIAGSFQGVTMVRCRNELKQLPKNTTSFHISNFGNAISAAALIGAVVTIILVVSNGTAEAEMRSWKMTIRKCEPVYQRLEISCDDFLQPMLDGDWPNEKLVQEISPTESDNDSGDRVCIPAVFGTAYIPVRPIWIADGFYYLLGYDDGPTYTVSAVHAPNSRSEWLSGEYSFNQYLKTINSVGYRTLQPIIADSDGDNIADACGIWAPGRSLLDMPCKFSRSDTESTTGPAGVIEYVLEDYGVPSVDIDTGAGSTFESAATTYSGWVLAFNGGWWQRGKRRDVLCNLLTQSHSALVVTDKVELHPRTTTSRATITKVLARSGSEPGIEPPGEGRFSYDPIIQREPDSGYAAWSEPGKPMDAVHKVLVPAKTTTSNISNDVITTNLVQDSVKAQKITALELQRKFLPMANISFEDLGFLLALDPDDFVTVDNGNYGGTYPALIEQIVFKPDLSLSFKAVRFADTIDNWGDLNPSVVNVSASTLQSVWSQAYTGPSSSGVPTVEPGADVTATATAGYNVNNASPILDVEPPSVDISTAANYALQGVLGIPHLDTGVAFGDSGTKLYLSEKRKDFIFQFNLATAWDVTTASFSGKFERVSNVLSLKFKPDGAKLYVLTENMVYEYSMSTAWDLSTISYSDAKSLSAQVPDNGQSLFFKADGTTMYVLRAGTDKKIYQYTLSTPWAISTASYDSKSYYVGGQDSIPVGVEFKTDGSKFYVLGYNNRRIYQYSIPTAWDLGSSPSYDSVYYSIIRDGSALSEFAFKSDGTAVYVMSGGDESLITINLSTGWDMSTASTPKAFFVPGAQDNLVYGARLSADGTKLYTAGRENRKIFQYTVSTAWDVSSAIYDSKACDISGQVTIPTDVFFSPDGLKMFVVDETSATIYQYALTVAWDVSTASYASKSLAVSGQESAPHGMYIGDSGAKLYVVGIVQDRVYQYNLPTAWDLNGATYAAITFSVAGQMTLPQGIAFSSDGKTMMMSDAAGDKVHEYALSVAWDISTAAYTSLFRSASPQTADLVGVFFNDDGTIMYAVDYMYNRIYQYRVYYPWSMYKVSYGLASFVGFFGNLYPTDGVFNADGTTFYSVGYDGWPGGSTTDVGDDNITVWQYDVSTPFDLSTMSFAGKRFSLTGIENTPIAIRFNPAGTKMFIAGRETGQLLQFTLSTAGDVTTAEYDNVSVSLSGQETGVTSVTFNDEGTSFYVAGYANGTVYQYTLPTAWDLNGATYANKSFPVGNGETWPNLLLFTPGGRQMFIFGEDQWSVFQYSLSTPWDVSTAAYDNKLYLHDGWYPLAMLFDQFLGKAFSVDATFGAVYANTVDVIDNIIISTGKSNPDGSVDLKVAWEWNGDEADIDGFFLFLRASDSSGQYLIGSTTAAESGTIVPAAKREHVFYGVEPDAWYVAGVQPYRRVNPAVNAAGIITAFLRQTMEPVMPDHAADYRSFAEQTTNPTDPASGRALLFVDINGDLIIKINHGGTVKSAILADFSAL